MEPLVICGVLSYFNPHRHKGGDPKSAESMFRFQNFNPHRHKGGDIEDWIML